MIYLIPIILCLLGMLLYDNPANKSKGWFLWLTLFVTLVSIFGLRYKVGGDTYNYMTFFSWAPDIYDWQPISVTKFEPGFTYLAAIVKTFTDDIYIYQTILSFLMTSMLMTFIAKNTEYKFLAMLIIFFSMYLYFSTEVIREGLALTGMLLIYPLWNRKHYVLYILMVLFLSSFHISALVGLFLPLADKMKLNKRFFVILFFFVLGSFALFPVIRFLSNYYIFEKLLRYDDLINVGYGWKGFRFIYFCLLPLYIVNLFHNKYKVPCKFEGIICLQIIFGVGLWIIPVVFQRLINYTIIFYLVSLAQMLGTVMRDPVWKANHRFAYLKTQRSMARIALVLTFLAHSTYYIHLGFWERYIPYHSYFDPIEVPERQKFVEGQN